MQEAIVAVDFGVVAATVSVEATTIGKQGSIAAETPKTNVFGFPTAASTHIAIAITSQPT